MDNNFVKNYKKNKKFLEENYIYKES